MMQVIRGGRLLDIDAHRADPADILIEGDTIREVGRPGLKAPDGARAIDAAGRLLMPGLANAHTHCHGNLAKGMGDRWNLELLLNAGPWTNGNRSLEDKHLTTLIGAVEMVRKGCTAAYDLTYEFPGPSPEGLEAMARAYAEVGMRATLAPMMADRSFYEAIPGLYAALPEALQREVDRLRLAPYEASLAACETVLKGWRFDRAQLRPALAPTIPHHCSEEFLIASRDLAREYDVGLHTHLLESKAQALTGVRLYGRTLCSYMDGLEYLGPDFVAAHAIWLDDDDIRRLADAGASVAHNPGSNARLGNGIAAARRMRDFGVNVGIGTDGASCSDNQNMFEAMRIASFVSRVQELDYRRWLATEEVLRMATAGSARALGFEGLIGEIKPGFKADIVFLDLSRINYVPLNDPTNQIVHAEDGTGVESVMIGGRMVVEKGRLTTVDEAKLARDAEAAAARLRQANAANRELVGRLEDLVGTFCVGLSRQPYHVERHALCHTGHGR
ncbi:MAG: amidohydrolase [Proteobacteria bacterium]|nr:amidohydrolase [Pseudomonadota bacterium]